MDYDPAKVIGAYRSVLGADPDNLVALNNLSVQYTEQRRYAEAESLITRAVQIGRGASFRQNLVNILPCKGGSPRRGRRSRSIGAVRRKAASRSGLDAWLAGAERDSPRAVDLFMQLRERNPDSRFYRLLTARSLASEYEKQGRLAEVRKIGREVMADAEAQGDSAQYVESAAQIAAMDLRYGSAPAKALAPMMEALKTHPLESMDPLDRPYLWLVYAFARGEGWTRPSD